MKNFKFFQSEILITHYNEPVYTDEPFYSMNRNEFPSTIVGEVIGRYTIIRRVVTKKFRETFVPDYDNHYYFKSEEDAVKTKEVLLHWASQLESLQKHYIITENE